MTKIQINQGLEYQHRFWKMQRIGWVVMLCVIAAALRGLLGFGPLSDDRRIRTLCPVRDKVRGKMLLSTI